jgi:hypothetical protein
VSTSELNSRLITYIIICGFGAVFSMASWLLLQRFVVSRLLQRPLSMTQPLWRKLLLGTVVGIIALWLMLWPPYFSGAFTESASGYQLFDPQGRIGHADPGSLLRFFVFQSFAEELIYRAFAFCLLATGLFCAAARFLQPQDAQPRWMYMNWLLSGLIVNVLVSGSFMLAHAGNPEVTPLALANIGLAGMLLGQLFWNQASVAGAGMLHTVWNSGLAILGLPVSGILVTQPLLGSARGAGMDLISGGSFGPEGGLTCTAALLLLLAYLLWQALPYESKQKDTAQDVPAAGEGA